MEMGFVYKLGKKYIILVTVSSSMHVHAFNVVSIMVDVQKRIVLSHKAQQSYRSCYP